MIERMLRDIGHYFKVLIFKDKWRKNNKNNYTIANNIFPLNRVEVGNYTYGHLNIHYFADSNEKLKIGNFCSIADNVEFYLGGNHDYEHLTTYPIKNKISNNNEFEATSKGPIVIEDDVWIGANVLILSGVTIHKGAVIGAGSIVTKDVPAYAVFVGNSVKKFRFDDEVIEKLNKCDFSKLDLKKCKDNLKEFYIKINNQNVDEIIEKVFTE